MTSLGGWFAIFGANMLVSSFRVEMFKSFDLSSRNHGVVLKHSERLHVEPASYPGRMETSALMYTGSLPKRL